MSAPRGRPAESWLAAVEEESTTEAINRALRGVPVDQFTDTAASLLVAADNQS